MQAHYELDMVGGDAAMVLKEFASRRWHRAATSDFEDRRHDPDDTQPALDEALFEDLMLGAVRHRAELDEQIAALLEKEGSFERLESLVRAILRVAAYELAHRIDTPAKVVLSEYVELARDFFDGSQVRLINGVLDSLAHKLRPFELQDRTEATPQS